MNPPKPKHSVKSDLIRAAQLFNDFNETAMRILTALDIEGKASGYCNNPKILRIQQTVADHYSMPVTVMTSKIRTSSFVEPRHVAMALCMELTRCSTIAVGLNFNRHRGAVVHASDGVQARRKADPAFANQYDALRMLAEGKLNAALPVPIQSAPILPLKFAQ